MNFAGTALRLALASGGAGFFAHHDRKGGRRLRFAEGPVWSRDGFLLFSDVPHNQILKMAPGDSAQRCFARTSGGANGNAFDSQGRLYTCESRDAARDPHRQEGQDRSAGRKWEGKRLNAPNDIVVRKDGHVYFTDPAFGDQSDTRELDFYGVYHITPKGELELIAKPQGRPNGIAFSPNGRILYVANSDERNVRAYDVDRTGEASNERVLISEIDGVPDGICTDEKGNCTWREGHRRVPAGRQTADHDSICPRRPPIARSATATSRPCTSRRGPRCTACAWT